MTIRCPICRFLFLIPIAALMLASPNSPAGVYTVSNGNDAGPGSYRQAWLDAQTDTDAEIIIQFDAGLLVQITSGDVMFWPEPPSSISNCPPVTIEGNGSIVDGGGNFHLLQFLCGGGLTVRNLTMQNASSGLPGAAINGHLGAATVRVENSYFLDNHSSAFGGAVFAPLVITVDSEFRRNESDSYGGAVTAELLQLQGTLFEDNHAGEHGGAIYLFGSSSSDSLVVASNFVDNSADGDGGALWLQSVATPHRLRIENSGFSGNQADANGGAVKSQVDHLEIIESTFDNNFADRGGAVYGFSASILISNSSLLENRAGDVGGAVWSGANGNLEILGSNFTANKSEGSSGGAIQTFLGHQALNIDNSRFIDNIAAHDGGAFHSRSTTVTINDSLFNGNVAEDDLGGAFSADGTVLVVNGSTFRDNIGAGQGGAIYVGGDLTVSNSTFVDNSTFEPWGAGGAIFSSHGELLLRHVTLTGNDSLSGAHLYVNQQLTAFGTVLAAPQTDDNCSFDSSAMIVSEGFNHDTGDSCGFGAGAGDVNNGADPALDDLGDHGGTTPTRPPFAHSPLVEAIPPAQCHPLLPEDQRGVARPQGTGCDIGAVELDTPAPDLIFQDRFQVAGVWPATDQE